METVRAFIAVDLPPLAKETVAEAQDYFKSLDLDAAWVKPGNIHLTLKFLGDIAVPKIAEIKRRVAPAVGGFPRISVSLGKVGVFPNLNRPRVLWIGLEDAAGSLKSLRDMIEHQLQAVGFKPELKKFSPHLTLGRIKSTRGKGRLREAVRDWRVSIRAEPVVVSSVKLYKSQLTPGGSIYTVLDEFKLGSGNAQGSGGR